MRGRRRASSRRGRDRLARDHASPRHPRERCRVVSPRRARGRWPRRCGASHSRSGRTSQFHPRAPRKELAAHCRRGRGRKLSTALLPDDAGTPPPLGGVGEDNAFLRNLVVVGRGNLHAAIEADVAATLVAAHDHDEVRPRSSRRRRCSSARCEAKSRA